MYPKILHIYGPIWINSYGLMVTLGIAVFLFLTVRHPLRKKLLPKTLFLDLVVLGIVAAIVGGRLLFVLECLDAYKDNWLEVFYPWVGGLSSLGCVLVVLLVVPFVLVRRNISVLRFLDLVSMHAPIIYAFGRIGCFLAGCCFGKETFSFPYILYSNPECIAPLHVKLIPIQLYESLGYFAIFFILRFVISKRIKFKGEVFCFFLLFVSLFRFVVDFFRADWEFVSFRWLPHAITKIVSFSQLVSATLFIGSLIGLVLIRMWGRKISK